MAALDERYRSSYLALLERVRRSLLVLYGATVTTGDIDAGFERLFPRAGAVIQSGQSASVSLATAYLSALVLRDTGRTVRLPIAPDLVGTSLAGSLSDGMAAWPAMVKARIAEGLDPTEALDYGRYVVERFGDAEVTRVGDRQTEHASRNSHHFRGWEGIVSGGSCGPCGDNAGFHELGESMYRHGGCRCSKQYVTA